MQQPKVSLDGSIFGPVHSDVASRIRKDDLCL
jgi:hypothetical protein